MTVMGNSTLPRRGATMSLSLGWAVERLIPKGKFTIDELQTCRRAGHPDDPRQVRRPTGCHASQAGKSHTISKRSARWWKARRQDELGCVVSDSMAGQFFSHIDQHESDCAFLTRLAKQVDGIATVKAAMWCSSRQGKPRQPAANH